jgi:hypothetical protein
MQWHRSPHPKAPIAEFSAFDWSNDPPAMENAQWQVTIEVWDHPQCPLVLIGYFSV